MSLYIDVFRSIVKFEILCQNNDFLIICFDDNEYIKQNIF